tara:strand:- start:12581 stop:13018 length:438 start_codon:yes stop_codon:yes gene_type:complete
MAHARQQIREQLATTLTGLTTTAARVFDTRLYSHDQLPCLTVFADKDTVDDEKSNSAKKWHDLVLKIEARAKAKESVEDVIDTICAEIETAIYADTTLNNKVLDIIVEDTQIEYSVEQDQPIALATLTLNAVYRVAPGAPQTLAN